MNPLISIAISSYNVEEFIGECLECIINQTLVDIEIICIVTIGITMVISIIRITMSLPLLRLLR